MKQKTQMDVIKSIRKSAVPPTRVERPQKGGNYKRPQNKEEVNDHDS